MRRSMLAAIAVVCTWTATALARDGIVIESYVKQRPADAGKRLDPLLAELAQRGFDSGDSIGRLYEGKVSRPRQDQLPADFEKQLKDGQNEYYRGNYAAAVAKLRPLIDSAHESSGAFAKNQALRSKMIDALIALALAQDRNGDPKVAKATLAELARSFPGTQVATGTWGAGAAKMYNDVVRELAQQTQGRLIVKTAATADVYVNERLEQTGTLVKSAIPGEYRIFARDAVKQSRTYRVQVNPAVDTTVTIDLDLDMAVHSSPGWTGLLYESASERERFESKHAALFRSAIDESGVIVVGIDGATIFGALVTLAGKDERRAMIPLTAGDTEKRNLAAFLAGEPASPGLVVLVAPGAPGNTIPRDDGGGTVPVAPVETPHRRWGGWPVLTGIAAAGAIGFGVYSFITDNKCTDGSDDPNCLYRYNTLPQAYLATGAGAVLAGVTVYLIVTRPAAPSRTAFVVPISGGAVAGITGRF